MSRPLRVCFVAVLGDSIHTTRWVEAMHGRGHEVLLVTQRPSPVRGVRVVNPYAQMRWRVPKLHHLAAYALTRRAIAAFRPDLVHLHWLDASPWMVRQARGWPRTVVSVWGRDVIWDGLEPEPAARVARKRALLAGAQEVTAITRFHAERTRPLLGPAQRLSVVPWGVDTARFRPRELPRGGAPVIGFAKHYLPKYGPDVLLEAMARVHARRPDARLVMVGLGDPTPYRRQASGLGLDGVVELRGAVAHDGIPALMRELDIFCMPSVYDSETFGVAAVEASASGLPVVATRVGGVAEAVVDGATGVLVPPRDPAALAAALLELLADPARARRLGAAGRDFVRDRYEWRVNVDAMQAVYDRVMQTEAAA
ncbi:MAG: glycosyltransferase [Deltaproteobacteria bacterium]|nr:glycosyltransferase [Deltaproteobacteria bacterium]